MKTIIVEGNKGFLFKKGKFIKMVEAGEYTSFNKDFGKLSIKIGEDKSSSIKLWVLSIFQK